MEIVKYTTQEEMNAIIIEKKAQGKILVEVSNVTEGDFLGFDEPKPETDVRLNNIESTLQQILQMLGGV